MKDYPTRILICAISFTAIVLFLVYVIDPYEVFQHETFPSLNAYKHHPIMKPIAKIALLNSHRCERVFIGSSRSEFAFDPDHPRLTQLKNCNLGISASFIQEQIWMFKRAVQTEGVREIVWSFDFAAFQKKSILRMDFKEKNFFQKFSSYLSWSSIRDSIQVLFRYYSGDFSGYTRSGYLLKPIFTAWPITRFKNDWNFYSTHPLLYRNFTLDSEAILEIDKLLNEAYKKNIKVIGVVLPVHVSHLALIQKWSLESIYLDWIEQLSKELRINGVYFVDFTSVAPPNDEPISLTREDMNWFWDTGHLKAKYGNLITEEIFSKSDMLGVEYADIETVKLHTRELFIKVKKWTRENLSTLKRLE